MPACQAQVQRSYRLGDVPSLVQAHQDIDLECVKDHEESSLGVSGEYVKAFVLGGLDGIVSTFALVSGLAGTDVIMSTLVIVTLAKIFADAFSMGFGEFMSASAELEQAVRLREREEWETDNCLDGEVKEMVELYMQKGCEKDDALTLMTVLSRYKELFIDHMMVMEHGVMPPDNEDRWQPLKQGVVCFLAFAVFGLIPVLGFIVAHTTGMVMSMGAVLAQAYVLTGAMLFAMGITKSKFTGGERHVKSGLLMVMNGTVAGGAAYALGDILTRTLAK